jgi:hypothetical protein
VILSPDHAAHRGSRWLRERANVVTESSSAARRVREAQAPLPTAPSRERSRHASAPREHARTCSRVDQFILAELTMRSTLMATQRRATGEPARDGPGRSKFFATSTFADAVFIIDARFLLASNIYRAHNVQYARNNHQPFTSFCRCSAPAPDGFLAIASLKQLISSVGWLFLIPLVQRKAHAPPA